MLLEVTLSRNDEDFGLQNSQIMINLGNVVAITKDEGSGSIFHVDLSDLGKFKKIYVKETYDRWFAIRLNP